MPSSPKSDAPRAPWRWALAGEVVKRLPDWRGRQRLGGLIAGKEDSDAVLPVRFEGPDIELLADLRISRHLFYLQYVPPALSGVIDTVVRPGDHAVDVGANEGIYTCWLARRVGPTGVVVAYEPVPETRARLLHNLERNQLAERVEVVSAAVGDAPGTTTVWAPPHLHGLASVGAIEGAEPIEVPLETLDQRFGDEPVRLVKVDVEGFEPAVVRGAERVLSAPEPPIVLIEVIETHLNRLGFTERDVLGPLEDAGYRVYELARKGLRPCTAGQPHAPNLVALHPGAHGGELEALRRLRFPRIQTY